MKAFLEEYGLVIVIVIVVAMLIGVASYVSREGKGKMEGTFDGLTKIGDQALKDGGVDAGSGGSGNTNP